jgi:signal transduction histidine kinase
VAVIAIRIGVRSGLRPLMSVAARIQAQSHRRLTTVSAPDVPAELQPVTQAVDSLLERLDHALHAQRRFIANAAHQLRTPFTALKLNIEQAQKQATLEGVRPLLAQLRLSSERATHLTQQLLTLARAEPDAVDADKFETFDLKAVVFAVGADWVPIAMAKGIEMSFAAERDTIAAWGNPILVREAAQNLLDNAIRYQHPLAAVGTKAVPGDEESAGRVDIVVFATPTPGFSIEDNGPGIAEDEMPSAFQRFRRGDQGGIEGSGLGLAIVQEIAASHKGRVSLRRGAGGRGLHVRFELAAPAATPRPPDPGR